MCYAVFGGHLLAICSSLMTVHYSFKLTPTLLGLVIMLINAPSVTPQPNKELGMSGVTPSLVIAFFLAPLSFHGNPRNKWFSCPSAEAKLRALATTIAVVIWLRWLLADLGVVFLEQTPLFCDNTSAI